MKIKAALAAHQLELFNPINTPTISIGFIKDNIKLCECGCGKPAPIAKETWKRKGWIKDQPKRFIQGHNYRFPKGAKNPAFNHGFSSLKDRTIVITRGKPRIKYWAIIVMENELFKQAGIYREILRNEDVHHKNENKNDDHPKNLSLLPSKKHLQNHHGYPIVLIVDNTNDMGRFFECTSDAAKFLKVSIRAIWQSINKGYRVKHYRGYYI